MYERSAIVLERYFEKLLGFEQQYNLKQNFKNYCDLFNKFNIFQTANAEEFNVLEDFQTVENTIEEIQASYEKIYKKNAKLEYNRDIIFSDISQKPEEIEKCVIKIENDISKNYDTLVSLRENFVQAVRDYNEQKAKLAKCKKNRKNAENEYNDSFEIASVNVDNIEEIFIEMAKNFATEENELELISIMAENGKEEKIPFNNSVITSAAKLGFDILKREVECYLLAYDMAKKLINELLEGAVSIELHEKTIRNINVKLNFLNAEKEYLIQFLDYERITVIYGKRTHRTLMVEACEKFETDTEQINNLYQLLLKEIANKSTKKAYKELYNKSYLIEIEEKDAKFKKEKNKINLPVGTIMNSNYWRIEGIKNIYTVFYKDVSEVFGKDLIEFDVPKEPEFAEEENHEAIEQVVETTIEENSEEIKVESMPETIEEIVEIDQVEKEEKVDIIEPIVMVDVEEDTIQENKAEEIIEVSESEIDTQPIIEMVTETISEVIEESDKSENIEVNNSIVNEIETTEVSIDLEQENMVENVEEIELVEPKKKKSKKSGRKKKAAEIVVETQVEEIVTEKNIDSNDFIAEISGIDELDDIEEISQENLVPEENIVETVDTIIEQEDTSSSFDLKILDEIEFGRKISGIAKFKKKKRKYTRKIGFDLELIEEEDIKVEEKEPKKKEKKKEVAFKKQKEETKKEKIKVEKSKNKKENLITETSLFEKINEEDIDEYEKFDEFSLSQDDIMEESIFGDIENKEYEELSLKKSEKSRDKKKGIFNKIIQINSKQKKEINS